MIGGAVDALYVETAICSYVTLQRADFPVKKVGADSGQ